MVFGFKKHQEEPQETDPTIIHEFNDVVIYPEEETYHKILRHIDNWGTSVKAANPDLRPLGQERGSVGQYSMEHWKHKPELVVDRFLIKQSDIRAENGQRLIMQAIYDLQQLKNLVTGADKNNKEILKNETPKPDLPSGLYSIQMMQRLHRLEDEIVPDGFLGEVSVLVEIGVDKASWKGGKKFEARIAHISNHIDAVEKVEKKASAKSSLKAMGGMYTNMFRKNKEYTDDSEWSVAIKNELDKSVKTVKYDIVIKDKDDKKHGIDIQEIMENFAKDIEPKIRDVFDYAFVKTDKEKELLLSESFLEDFYA